MQAKTIPCLFETSVEQFPNNIYLWEKRDGAYQGMTYRVVRERVQRLAAGLLALGVEHGDRIALISEGRADWVVSELAVLYCGAVNVPVSVKLNELSDLKFRLAHAGCRLVIVSAGQRHKVEGIENDLPDLEKVILLDAVAPANDSELQLAAVLELGDEYLQENRDRFEARWQAVGEDDYANICYTSGTTADPKGIILTHKNYVANVEQSLAALPVPQSYCTLLILPWDHAFAHTVGIYALMKNGSSLAAIEVGPTPLETVKNIPRNIKEVRPGFLLSVPALAKSFRGGIEKQIRNKGPKVEGLFRKALALAYRYNGLGWDKGRGFRVLRKPLLALYDKLIFSKIRAGFGGRLDFFIGGGALLDIEMQRFFYAVGMPMYQGYGLSEAAPVVSTNTPTCHKLGSSGRVIPGVEVRIVDEAGQAVPEGEKGEIAIRGENVMAGYWHNEAATAEALRDGWLYSGDLGYLDRDGFLYVLGRTKSLLIGNDGEKYSPEGIEEALIAHSRFFDQMLLHNNQSPYTVALLVPNKAAAVAWLEACTLSHTTQEGQDALLGAIEEDLAAFREGGAFAALFPGRWLPASFALLGEGFTEQNRMLNSTLKMVRSRITDFYRSRLDYMYTPEGKDVYNHQNRTIISRF